jgi:hypothetical protein
LLSSPASALGLSCGQADCGGIEAEGVMDEQARIYREYCWFALVLLVLAIGLVGRTTLGGTSPHADPAGAPASRTP